METDRRGRHTVTEREADNRQIKRGDYTERQVRWSREGREIEGEGQTVLRGTRRQRQSFASAKS